MDILIGILIFLAVVFLIEGIYWLVRHFTNPERKKIKQRIKTIAAGQPEEAGVELVKKKVMSDVPWLNRWLFKLPVISKVDRLREQAGSGYPIGFFILLSLFLAFIGLFLGAFFQRRMLFGAAAALVLGAVPYLYLIYKKKQRMQKFERLLPDVLDMIARSLRAGHAFSGTLQMVAEEFADPIGTEFERTFNEINYGVDVPHALKNLTERVDVADLKFFAVAVVIQRETGGNLAEILEKISSIIRERFVLAGQVKALTAEGRLSAIILCGLPFLMAFVIYLLNPDYMKSLTEDPLGPFLIGATLFFMLLGIIFIRRIIQLRV